MSTKNHGAEARNSAAEATQMQAVIDQVVRRKKFFSALGGLGLLSVGEADYLDAFVAAAASGVTPDEIRGLAQFAAAGRAAACADAQPARFTVGEMTAGHLGAMVTVEYRRSKVTGRLDKVIHSNEVTSEDFSGHPILTERWTQLTIGGIDYNLTSSEFPIEIEAGP